ncbi:hypothetical protein [Oleidesulfovibrio alaskensis]|uniref:hypothetical protein n=1 Tax=Oleidesulfovibrio alaskensis TaxID=58180 RepID=UPI000416A59E|nr:hypothetical protein [Oleidesulfovibrio alaskensis]
MNGTGWSLDRKVTLTALTGLFTAVAGVMAMGATLQYRVQQMESSLGVLAGELAQGRRTAVQVERLEERVVAVQQVLEEVRLDVRELRQQRLTAWRKKQTHGDARAVALLRQTAEKRDAGDTETALQDILQQGE